MFKLYIICLFLLPMTIFSNGIYDGDKDVPVTFHVYDSRSGLPIDGAEIYIELLTGRNLMSSNVQNTESDMMIVTDNNGEATFTATYGFANGYAPIEHPVLGDLEAFITIDAFSRITKDGYIPTEQRISQFERYPLLFPFEEEYMDLQALYDPSIEHLNVIVYLTPLQL